MRYENNNNFNQIEILAYGIMNPINFNNDICLSCNTIILKEKVYE